MKAAALVGGVGDAGTRRSMEVSQPGDSQGTSLTQGCDRAPAPAPAPGDPPFGPCQVLPTWHRLAPACLFYPGTVSLLLCLVGTSLALRAGHVLTSVFLCEKLCPST